MSRAASADTFGVETPPRPKVALCAHEIHDDGGMERAFAELIRHSAHKVDFVVVSSVLQKDLQPLVTWMRVPTPARPAPARFALFWLLAGTRLTSVRRDVLHTLGAITWPKADVLTVQFCHEAFARVTTLGGENTSAFRRLNRALHRALALSAERFCYRSDRARLFAAVSPGVQRELTEHYPETPVTLTPNGVDADRFRPDPLTRRTVRAEQGTEAGEVVAIFVGGDWGRKGLEVAIRALAIAGGSASAPLRLWIVGEGNQQQFRALARELGIEERVTFLGRRQETERFLQAADLFVFPTSYETFSLASYEAAASGLPVLATRVSGIEDLLGDDEAGLGVPPTPEAVAAGLVRLAAEPALRDELGLEGRRRAGAFSWERSASSVLEAYARVLGGTPAAGFSTTP